MNGSPEYVLTWKEWDMISGPPICALRARARRISDKGFTGWGTPNTMDHLPSGNLEQSPWVASVGVRFLDGKTRRVMPGIALLANGFPNRVALLRGFGNAIVPQLAAEFIRAFMDCEGAQ